MWVIGFDTLHYGDDMKRWPDQNSVMKEANDLKEQLEEITAAPSLTVHTEQEQEGLPRLVKWAKDGYPPMDISNELPAITELIREYDNLKAENERLKEAINGVLKDLSASMPELIDTANDEEMTLYNSYHRLKEALNNNPLK